MNITDPIRKHAQANPDATAVIRKKGRTVSYREFDRMIDFVAAKVQGLGLGAGALVGLRSRRPYPDLCFRLALARLGVGMAPPTMPAGALAVCLTDGDAPEKPGMKFESIGRLWSADLAPSAVVPAVPSHQDGAAVCGLFPTSGTTGTPKLVAVSHDVMAHRISTRAAVRPLTADARLLCIIGPGTAYGLLRRLGALWAGGTVVMTMRSEDILSSVDRDHVTHLAMAPFSLDRLLKGLPDRAMPRPFLREIEIAGGALPPRLRDVAHERLCANICSQYGATESGPVAGAPVLSLRSHPGAVGFLLPGIEAQAVDADDQPLPPGTEGTLRVRSGGCAHAYAGDPAASAKVFRHGWVYPGDVGTVAPDGLLTVTGRADDVINQGGAKVSPQAVEEVLLSVAEIADAAAFGFPDAMGVMRIWAAIVPNGPVDLAAIRTFCRERLQNRAPTAFLKMKALPRSETGKVLRDELCRKAAVAVARRKGPPAAS